ncbi:unnamed protein product [[Actinomadura] parvosata subsp. kistnae]|nr:unnamed protein product [Actinomadura parvosata subsp. kistnae]
MRWGSAPCAVPGHRGVGGSAAFRQARSLRRVGDRRGSRGRALWSAASAGWPRSLSGHTFRAASAGSGAAGLGAVCGAQPSGASASQPCALSGRARCAASAGRGAAGLGAVCGAQPSGRRRVGRVCRAGAVVAPRWRIGRVPVGPPFGAPRRRVVVRWGSAPCAVPSHRGVGVQPCALSGRACCAASAGGGAVGLGAVCGPGHRGVGGSAAFTQARPSERRVGGTAAYVRMAAPAQGRGGGMVACARVAAPPPPAPVKAHPARAPLAGCDDGTRGPTSSRCRPPKGSSRGLGGRPRAGSGPDSVQWRG